MAEPTKATGAGAGPIGRNAAKSPGRITIETYTADRQALRPFFALADDSPAEINGYIDAGDVLVARDGAAILGHVQIISAGSHAFEIKNLAVGPQSRGQGIGGALVAAAIKYCTARHANRVIVTTATADIGNLRFYQRQGFRMTAIVTDAFGPANGYDANAMIDGIALNDAVVFERELN